MDEIKLLLEKYYGGQSSVAEERRLRELLSLSPDFGDDSTLQADARAFMALEQYADAELEEIARRTEAAIDLREAAGRRRNRRRLLALAASLALLVAAGVFFIGRGTAPAEAPSGLMALKEQIEIERGQAPGYGVIEVTDSLRAAEMSRSVLDLLASKLERSAGAVARTGEIGTQSIARSLSPLQKGEL